MADTYTFIPGELSDRKATKLPLALIDTGDTMNGQVVYGVAVSTDTTADAIMWIEAGTGTKVQLGLVALGTSPETYAFMVNELGTILDSYEFLAHFTDTDTAPITTPHIADKGTLVVVDDNLYIRTNGVLHFGNEALGVTPATAWGEAQLVTPTPIVRAQGRVLSALVTLEDAFIGFALYWSATGTQGEDPTSGGEGWILVPEIGQLRALRPDGVVVLGADTQNIRPGQYLVTVVLQSAGYYVLLSSFGNEFGLNDNSLIGIPAYPSARVVWVDQTATTVNLYPTLQFRNSLGYPGGTVVEDLRVIDAEEVAYTTDNGLAIITDRFTRADSNVSLGGSWTADAGTWGIASNQGKLITPSGFSRAYLTAQADCIVQCTITTPADLTSAAWGLMLRRVDSGNFLRLWNNFTSNTLTFQYWTGGGFGGTIYTSAYTWNAATSYVLTVLMKGNKYFILVNGVAFTSDWTADAGSNHITGTGMGLYGATGANQATYDNFAVYPHTVTLPAVLGNDAVPTVVSGGATLGSDTFTDTNGTSLAAHTATSGGAWTVHNGTIEIQSNKADPTAFTSALARATQNLGVSDVEAQIVVTTPSAWNAEGRLRAGLVMRYIDANNYIQVRLFRDQTQPGADEIEVLQFVGGTGGIVHKVQLGPMYALSTAYTLKAQAIGNLLMVFLDMGDGNGSRPCMAFYMDAALAGATRFGIYSDDVDSGAVFDNWSAKAL